MPESYTTKLPLEQLLRYKILGYRGADGQPLQDCEFVVNFNWTYFQFCDRSNCFGSCSMSSNLILKASVATTGSRATLTVSWADSRGSYPFTVQVMSSGPVWKGVADTSITMPLIELIQHCSSAELTLCFRTETNFGSATPSPPDKDLGTMIPNFVPMAPELDLAKVTDFSPDNSESCYFLVDGKEFHVQRKFLVKAGDVFERMLTDDLEEKRTGRIPIVGFSADEMETFLTVLNCPDKICNFVLKDNSVLFSIYNIANKYNVLRILELCERAFLYIKIDQDSICDAIKVAHRSHNEALWFSCFVAYHNIPKEFWKSEKFLTFSVNNIEAIGEFMTMQATNAAHFKTDGGFTLT